MRSGVTIAVPFAGVCLAALLVACNVHGAVPSSTAFTNSAVHEGNTDAIAWGRLVDDPSGKPLRGVRVRLEPWRPCRAWIRHGKKLLSCPKAIATATTQKDGKFELRAPRGHYLLVIGSDDPADLTRPTIHDNVHLVSGAQHLFAPTPCPTFAPSVMYDHCLPQLVLVTLNPTELSGDYRLVSIDAKYETPCIQGFDYFRNKAKLASAVVDEWITENDRNSNKMAGQNKFQGVTPPWYGWPSLDTGFSSSQGGTVRKTDGEPGCWYWNVRQAFDPRVTGSLQYSGKVDAHWFSGTFGPWNKLNLKGNLLGSSQYPRDPRNFRDPNVPNWP